MIKGMRSATLTYEFSVSGEGPVDRPYSSTKIVPATLRVTYQRTIEAAWEITRLEISGFRARNDGTPGGNPAESYWSPWRGGWATDGVEPPLWATLVAANNLPAAVGPLPPLMMTEPVELDS